MVFKIILLLIAGICNAGMDVLKFAPGKFPGKSDWWHERGKYAWDKRSRWVKYGPLSVLSGGWHCLKGCMLICICVAAMGWWFWLGWFAFGIGFELVYNLINRDSLKYVN